MKKVKKYGIIERDHRKNYANMNEFPIDIDSRLKEKLLRKVQESSWQKYSIHLESKTIQSLKGLFNIKNLGVIPTQGADGALDILCKAILTPESRVLIPYHTYGQFINFVETMGATILYHGIEKGNLSYKAFVEKNKDSINQLEKYGSIDVVYLPNPHSPLGFIYEEKTILELIKKHKQIKFIIDETYIDFNGKSLINHIHKLKNLIIVRSFSKSYPLAGIRLGAVLYNKENHPLFEPFYSFNIILYIKAR